jgi:hypothetical protein
MTVYLMSTTVIPSGAWGRWEMDSVDLTQVQLALYPENGDGYVSAVGHESTAQIMTELTGQPVAANRITVQPVPGDVFYCFKLDKRPPEGAILDRAQLEELGYSWARMKYVG